MKKIFSFLAVMMMAVSMWAEAVSIMDAAASGWSAVGVDLTTGATTVGDVTWNGRGGAEIGSNNLTFEDGVAWTKYLKMGGNSTFAQGSTLAGVFTYTPTATGTLKVYTKGGGDSARKLLISKSIGTTNRDETTAVAFADGTNKAVSVLTAEVGAGETAYVWGTGSMLIYGMTFESAPTTTTHTVTENLTGCTAAPTNVYEVEDGDGLMNQAYILEEGYEWEGATVTLTKGGETLVAGVDYTFNAGYLNVIDITADLVITIAAHEIPAPAGCDWDNIAALGDGVQGGALTGKYKICLPDGSGINAINVQHPGFAAKDGIYVTCGSADRIACGLPSGSYVIDGAGMVLYLDAFTAKETTFTISYGGNDYDVTVWYADGAEASEVTFDVIAGDFTFTVTPSNLLAQYYIEVLPAEMDSATFVAYIDATLEEMGEDLDYFAGIQTQSYEYDWYIDEPGDYKIFVCAVSDTYERTTGVTIVEFTYGEPAGGPASFENVVLDPNSTSKEEALAAYIANEMEEYFWMSGDYGFVTYIDDWDPNYYYYDIVVSNHTDAVFDFAKADYDLHSAAGCAAEGANYAVWYSNFYGNAPVYLSEPAIVSGMAVTNTSWVVNAILSGDGMSTEADSTTGKPFGQGDYLKLTATGMVWNADEELEENGQSADFYLADFRTAGDWKYAANWQWFDLTSLGEVNAVAFSLTSTKANSYGMTTPTYFCFDNFGGAAADCTLGAMTVVPNPQTGVENAAAAVRAEKRLENGQVVIIKNGVRYNMVGTIVK